MQMMIANPTAVVILQYRFPCYLKVECSYENFPKAKMA